jgi:hypothetical protein
MGKRNILRKLYRSVSEQGVRRIRIYQELKELYKSPDLVEVEVVGALIRMDQTKGG